MVILHPDVQHQTFHSKEIIWKHTENVFRCVKIFWIRRFDYYTHTNRFAHVGVRMWVLHLLLVSGQRGRWNICVRSTKKDNPLVCLFKKFITACFSLPLHIWFVCQCKHIRQIRCLLHDELNRKEKPHIHAGCSPPSCKSSMFLILRVMNWPQSQCEVLGERNPARHLQSAAMMSALVKMLSLKKWTTVYTHSCVVHANTSKHR